MVKISKSDLDKLPQRFGFHDFETMLRGYVPTIKVADIMIGGQIVGKKEEEGHEKSILEVPTIIVMSDKQQNAGDVD